MAFDFYALALKYLFDIRDTDPKHHQIRYGIVEKIEKEDYFMIPIDKAIKCVVHMFKGNASSLSVKSWIQELETSLEQSKNDSSKKKKKKKNKHLGHRHSPMNSTRVSIMDSPKTHSRLLDKLKHDTEEEENAEDSNEIQVGIPFDAFMKRLIKVWAESHKREVLTMEGIYASKLSSESLMTLDYVHFKGKSV